MAWLGAGAITLGMGAAMASGTGVANADTGSESSGSSSASSSESGSDTKSAKSSESVSSPVRATRGVTSVERSSSIKDDDKKTDLTDNSGDGSVDTETDSDPDDDTADTSEPEVKPTARDSATIAAVAVESDEDSHEPIDEEPVVAAIFTLPAVAARESKLVESAPNAVATGLVVDPILEPTSAPSPLVVESATATTYTDAEWDAYIQQFRDIDPELEYYTPASPDWPRDNISNYSAELYAYYIAYSVETFGSVGFVQTASGALQYTNTYEFEVGVLYGQHPPFDTDVNLLPTGFVRVTPGETVLLPGALAHFAQVQMRPAGNQWREYLEFAAAGYSPFEIQPPTVDEPPVVDPTAPGQHNIEAFVRGIGAAFQAVTGFFGSTIGSLLVNGIDFVFNYAVPVLIQGWNAAAKATFDGLTSIQKSLLIGQLADAADTGRLTAANVFQALRGVLSKVSVGFSAYAVAEAYQASQNARSASDVVHAGIDTAAANAPFAGAAAGLAIGGPPGAAVGFAVGSAAGLGLAVGNTITKLFGW